MKLQISKCSMSVESITTVFFWGHINWSSRQQDSAYYSMGMKHKAWPRKKRFGRDALNLLSYYGWVFIYFYFFVLSFHGKIVRDLLKLAEVNENNSAKVKLCFCYILLHKSLTFIIAKHPERGQLREPARHISRRLTSRVRDGQVSAVFNQPLKYVQVTLTRRWK